MQKFRKVIAVILVFSTLISSVTLFASAKEDCDCSTAPLIVVSGFATVPLYLDEGTDAEEKVWAPQSKLIVNAVLKLIFPIVGLCLTGNWTKFTDTLCEQVMSVFKNSLCDADGNSVSNVRVRKYPLSADNHSDFYLSDNKDEQAFVMTAVYTLPQGHTYFFSYDWRLDPMDNSRDLADFVEKVKSETGHDKVVLAGCSMGGAITLSYLSQFGSDDVRSVILDNSAFQGTTLVGELLNLEFAFDKETIIDYILQFISAGEGFEAFLEKLLTKTHIVDSLIRFAEKVIDNTEDGLSEKVLYPVFAYMPGMWTLVCDADYEKAKENSLDKEINKELIKKIDTYHYNVQQKAKEILSDAKDNGCNIMIVTSYNSIGTPLTKSHRANNDLLIGAELASGGAVIADIGETLPDDYTQATDCGHNHISADRVIDASTCMFPEYTWFVKDMKHLDFPYGSEAVQFLMWLVQADEQYTVRTNEKYPQFMYYTYADKTLNPLK